MENLNDLDVVCAAAQFQRWAAGCSDGSYIEAL